MARHRYWFLVAVSGSQLRFRAGEIAGGDIGSGIQLFCEELYEVRMEYVVRIQKSYEVTLRDIESGIPGGGETTVGLMQGSDPGI